MPRFETTRRVLHTADNMFALVADVESYPQFVPMCQALRILKREQQNDDEVITARMIVAYKLFQESFTSRVRLNPKQGVILVNYLDGPFRHLENRWRFQAIESGKCEVSFYLEYEFQSKTLQFVMGAVFDRAFRKFATAFEARADTVYGRPAGKPSLPLNTQ